MSTAEKATPQKRRRRSHKWSPGQLAKFRATMAAKRAAAVTTEDKIMNTPSAKAARRHGVQHFPLAAIPPKRTAGIVSHFNTRHVNPNAAVLARRPRLVATAHPPRAMRVVVKPGTDITVTIGGVEVQIVAEGK